METNKIMTFNYEANKVRTIENNGEPWFVLKDVCKVLELSNPTVVAQRLDDDERTKLNLGRQGETLIINESGLYSVILRSDKPQSKQFRKWVTGEVLPSIRKTGSYGLTQIETKTNTLKEENQRIKKAQLMHEISKDMTEPICKKVLQRHITELLTGENIEELQLKATQKQNFFDKIISLENGSICLLNKISEPFMTISVNDHNKTIWMNEKDYKNPKCREKCLEFLNNTDINKF